MSSKVPKKKQNKKPLISVDLKDEQPENDELQKPELIKDEEPEEEPKEDDEEDDEKNEGYYYDKPPKEDKPKKPRTEKQLEQLRQERVKALVNKEMKRKEKEQEQEKIKKK